jgi:glycosidase
MTLLMIVMASASLPLRSARAQFASPIINGVIGTGEYGAHADGQNQQSTGTAQTWFMTWDDTNLYVANTNANLFEASVLYIDINPVSPVNGGNNGDGSLAGFNYDNTGFAQLPFRADFVAYFKEDYREFRKSNGSGGWSGQTAFFGSYASGPGNVRELAIPWSAITGGARPASFLFFGYLTSPGGFVFGQVPNENPGAFIGTSATYTRYYTVSSTANGASSRPFSLNSTSDTNDIHFLGLRHDTFDPYYRSPFGAVPSGAPVTLRFRTDHLDVDGVSVRVYHYNPATDATSGPLDFPMTFLENRVENGVLYDIWTRTLATPGEPAIFFYKFRVTDGADVDFYSDAFADDHDNLNQGGEGEASDNEPFPSFQLTIYDPNFRTPEWLHSANVYHIFPDRFRNGDPTNDYCVPGSSAGCPVIYGDQNLIPRTTWNEAIFDPRPPGPFQGAFGNQYFGGDLKGIEEKLDYLQSVGFDTIYLNPIFKARSNHRFDTDNYLEVDPALGGDAALASLVKETERRGMRLIFDAVFNHSSSDSLYFDRYHRYPSPGAAESLASPFRSWFNFFNDNVPAQSPDYESWFGFDSLPVFVDNSPQVRDFFFRTDESVLKHWYDRGVSGWRFDVATDISHNWWHEFRPFAKAYRSDGPLIGENFPDASQYLAGDQLDSVMNYRFRKNVIGFARGAAWVDNDNNGNNTVVSLSPSQFDRALRSVREDYPPQATAAMLNLIGSHDTNRALYVLTETGDSGLAQARERLKLAALFQFTYPGAPMIYYGDEAALNSPALANGPNGPEDDPYNRAPYPWDDEAGDPGVYGPADQGLIDYYRSLAHLRKGRPSLRTGSFETLLTGDTTPSGTDNNTYAFARVSGADKAVVALNNGTGPNTAGIPVGAYFSDGTTLQDALSGATFTVSGGSVTLALAARSGAILLPFPAAPDTAPPVATAAISPAPNANGWNNSALVTVNLGASDGGSGIKELRYWLDGGGVNVAPGDSASVSVSAEGITTVNVRALDNAGNISALVSRVVKIDRTAPAVSCPAPGSIPAGAGCSASVPDVLASVTASDNLTPGGSIILTQSPAAGAAIGKGPHTITVSATDLAGNTGTCTATLTVIDSAAPSIAGASVDRPVIWPPNHKMVTVTVSYAATDNCGPVATVLGVTSNEPEGDTAPDWEIIDAHHVRLRAERDDSGNGRVYTIRITSTDASGNSATKTLTVTVPKGQS